MYEYGHNQWNKEFDNEDVCEIMASSHDIIHEIVEEYFKPTVNIDLSREDLSIFSRREFGKDEGWKEMKL
jgi:hypothetical protein